MPEPNLRIPGRPAVADAIRANEGIVNLWIIRLGDGVTSTGDVRIS